MRRVTFEPIGVVRSPFTERAGTPIQPAAGAGIEGTVVLEPAYAAGLADVDGFSHLFLIYVFHRTVGPRLRVVPYLDAIERGVFATRAPDRPNPIGLSVVRLLGRDDNVLRIADLDILDGTPVLDIKPYIPQLEPPGEVRVGWLAGLTDGLATIRAPADGTPRE